MQIKEAIEFLSRYLDNEYYTNKCNKAHQIAISALEKQIPKKVTHEATLAKCRTCPHCKNVVDKFTTFAGVKVRVTYDYCHFCGQALDWSDT